MLALEHNTNYSAQAMHSDDDDDDDGSKLVELGATAQVAMHNHRAQDDDDDYHYHYFLQANIKQTAGIVASEARQSCNFTYKQIGHLAAQTRC